VTGLLGAGLFGRQSERPEGVLTSQTEALERLLDSPSRPGPLRSELRLYGQNWQLESDAPRITWARPTRGQRSLVYGELLDGPADAGGAKVGELYATCTCVDAPFGVTATQFTLRRTASGAFRADLVITDACGEWRTFVGGGTDVP
jgi:hypothetical protein